MLRDFSQSILGAKEAETPNRRRTVDPPSRNGNDFEKKFRQYEDEIDTLRSKLESEKQKRLQREEQLAAANQTILEEQEMTKRLMKTINEMTDAHQQERQKERETLQFSAQSEVGQKEEAIKELQMELDLARVSVIELETSRGELADRLQEAEARILEYQANWVKKEEYDRLAAEKVQKEYRFSEAENKLAIEMAKTATYETQIEKMKGQLKASSESESRLRIEVDQLTSRIANLNTEIRMLSANRKGSLTLQFQEEPRHSGNLDIDESGLSPIQFSYSRVEDDVTRRIEEIERAHSEAQANLKAKIRELLTANETLNNEVLRLKDANSSIKADSMVLKRSSYQVSQRDVSKFKRAEVSEEMLEKLLNSEILNKKLKDETVYLQAKVNDLIKTTAAQVNLIYAVSTGYLSQEPPSKID